MAGLIQEVIAQSEPTFPYNGPFEEPGGPGTQVQEAAIKLATDTSTLQISSTATCDLTIESGQGNVKTYSISISFNPTILEVVDANTALSGVQINSVDQFSTVQINNVDNSGGTIRLTANINGNPAQVNRRVAQITFRAKRSGTSVVSINKADSSVIDSNNKNIIGATTSLNFTVSGQTQTTVTTTKSGTLPHTGITDTLATTASVIAGFVMLYAGIKAVNEKVKEKK
jgi:hypothetical protein